LGVKQIHCEQIAAPEEQADVAALRAAGLDVHTHWQSSLLEPDDLPFDIEQLPRVFTRFREWIEKAQIFPRKASAAPNELPVPPDSISAESDIEAALGVGSFEVDPRSAFPYSSAHCRGGETAALRYSREYFESERPQSYKLTRNGLVGLDYSTKFSPWLASGAISPRRIFEDLKAHEAAQGANESTYWIWFELLWRDYFRLLHLQHGKRLYHAAGLSLQGMPRHDRSAFLRWCQGASGERFIHAGMRELAHTGYLSNRLRQNVASYLVHDLCGDWRAGAAWFEHQLVDFDIYSNQGNWLYVSGRGTDPRIGRRFDPDRQARQYDVDGAYRRLWLES
jgi:deoxyribodipyrimidine photo-lyase